MAYEDWFADDSVVISWMVINMDESVARLVMMLKHHDLAWDTLGGIYEYEKNIVKSL